MNKWQIICPLALLLVVMVWMGHAHFQIEEKIMGTAIERHLGLVLTELEAHQDGGRFPTVAAATAILNNADVEKKVHLTSLFGTRDLWYNPSRPVTGSDLDLVAARVGERLFSIRGNRQVQEGKDKFL